jgi:hypothetical protein
MKMLAAHSARDFSGKVAVFNTESLSCAIVTRRVKDVSSGRELIYRLRNKTTAALATQAIPLRF